MSSASIQPDEPIHDDRLAKHEKFLQKQAELQLGGGRCGIASASDFVQDALVAALEQERKGAGPAPIPAVEAAYLWRTLRNTILAAFRKANTEIHGGKARITSIEGDELPGSATSPSEKVHRKSREEILEKALRSLELEDQDVLTLKFADGKTSQEIGALRGVTARQARNQVQQAVARLREAYIAAGGPWDFS